MTEFIDRTREPKQLEIKKKTVFTRHISNKTISKPIFQPKSYKWVELLDRNIYGLDLFKAYEEIGGSANIYFGKAGDEFR